MESDNFFFNLISQRIYDKFRPSALRFFGQSHFNSSNNFGVRLPPKSSGPDRRIAGDKVPIFWEFVQELISTHPEDYNVHWQPISALCFVCEHQYNYVLKLETLESEQRRLIRHLGWPEIENVKSNANPNHHSLTSRQITQLYFKDIPDDDVRKLYEIYEADFKMFGYTFNHNGVELPIGAAAKGLAWPPSPEVQIEYKNVMHHCVFIV